MLTCRLSGFPYISLPRFPYFLFPMFHDILLLFRSSFIFPGLPWHFSQWYLCFICYSAVRNPWFASPCPFLPCFYLLSFVSLLSPRSPFFILFTSPSSSRRLFFSFIGCLVPYLYSLIFQGYIPVSPLCANRSRLILSIYSLN